MPLRVTFPRMHHVTFVALGYNIVLDCVALHYIALCYFILRYSTLLYFTFTLHCVTLLYVNY